MKKIVNLFLTIIGWSILISTIVAATISIEKNEETTIPISVLKKDLNEAKAGCSKTPKVQASMLNKEGQLFLVPCSVLNKE